MYKRWVNGLIVRNTGEVFALGSFVWCCVFWVLWRYYLAVCRFCRALCVGNGDVSSKIKSPLPYIPLCVA